jgi:predicted acylesterase/phospholipase RssA
MSAGWKPRGISFSAGGVRVLGQLGVLARLMEAGVTDEVTDWYGCSGGCMSAFIGAVGATPGWIREIATHFDMGRLVVPEPVLLAAYMDQWGVSDGQALLDFYCRVMEIWAPGSSQWTFADLARERPGVHLTMLATNVTRGAPELFCLQRTPNARIIRDAMRASMAVPLFFTPSVNGQGEHLCDGCVIEPYIWSSIHDKANTLVIECDDVGIMGRALPMTPVRSLSDFIGKIFLIGHQYSSATPVPRYWIAVNDEQSFLKFKITQEETQALFRQGQVAADRWLAFRRQAAAGGTDGNHPGCGGPSILSSDHPSPDRTSGSRQSRSPPLLPYPSRDSRSEGRLPARRWSL